MSKQIFKLYIPFLLFLFPERAICQKETSGIQNKYDTLTLTFDGESQKFTGDSKLVVNQDGKVVIELKNINQFIYDVKIRETQDNSVSEEKLTNSEFSSSNLLIKRFERSLPRTFEPLLVNAKIEPQVIGLIKDREENSYVLENLQFELEEFALNEKSYNEYRIQEINDEIGELEVKIKDSVYREKKNDLLFRKSLLLEKLPEVKSDLKEINDRINELNLKIEKVEDTINYESNLIDSLTQDGETQHIPLIQFQKSIEQYWEAYGSILDLKPYYETMLSIVQSDRTYEKVKRDLRDLTFRSFSSEIYQEDFEFSFSFELIISELCYRRLKTLRTRFSDVHSKFSNLILDDNLVDSSKMLEALDRIKENYDIVSNSDIELLIREIGAIYNAVNEENWNFKYETFVIDDKADKIFYEIIVTPKPSLLGLVKPQGYKRTVDVIIRKGWKIDGSAGFLFNMSWFGFSDSTYFFKALSDSTTQIISQRQNQQFLPNLALMFTVYPRSAWNCKPGLGFGVSTNTESLKYYLGGVLVLGRSERINLCAGMVGGRVARISDIYDPSVIINQNRADLEESVPMMDPAPFRFGVYFGVTFNFIGASNSSRLNGVIGN